MSNNIFTFNKDEYFLLSMESNTNDIALSSIIKHTHLLFEMFDLFLIPINV